MAENKDDYPLTYLSASPTPAPPSARLPYLHCYSFFGHDNDLTVQYNAETAPLPLS